MELERFEPGQEGGIWYEHWHRYHFALPLARGIDVLDIASGEGYGSHLLAGVARRVIGVDVSKDCVLRARRRYGTRDNLEYLEGRCEAIPLPDASVDLVVSFETLEHIPAPEKLVDEAVRVLRPGGRLLVSTPDKAAYSDERGFHNEHHVHELHRDEFAQMLRSRFGAVALFGQRLDTFSAIWPLEAAVAATRLFAARANAGESPDATLPAPMYVIALCGPDEAALATGAGAFSLLGDHEHAEMKGYESAVRKAGELEARIGRLEAALAASQQQLARWRKA